MIGIMDPPKMVIKVSKKPTSFCPRTEHDHSKANILSRKYYSKLPMIKNWLEQKFSGSISMSTLVPFAKEISEQFNIHLGRLEKRNKTVLLCWFAQNWSVIQPSPDSIEVDEWNDSDLNDISVSDSHDIQLDFYFQ